MSYLSLRNRIRRAPFGWALLAILVALGVLGVKTAGLVTLIVLTAAERVVAVALVVVAWADEQASHRAGLPPLAATVGEFGAPR